MAADSDLSCADGPVLERNGGGVGPGSDVLPRPPVVRFVGSVFVDTLPLLENAARIHKTLPLLDSKGVVVAGEMPPREPPAEPV